ncbi:hypothetical protein AeMF1_004366 [Aphanomyces euteiches]|nr:hypothetical protein AeMF1_004366 [Aphanomyces euteiches]KAH9190416.1 hypothetical protein AeNC1_007609 [Aphanomyces euteiches]
MPNQRERKGPTTEDKRRVLDAFNQGNQDWKTVAKHNGVSLSTARRMILSNRAAVLPHGGSRQGLIKVTPAILKGLEGYLNSNYHFTLSQMQTFVAYDFDGVKLSLSTISRHDLGMVCTMKQVRIELVTCNNEVNKIERLTFAQTLIRHQQQDDYIVYYDETNYNCIVSARKATQKG